MAILPIGFARGNVAYRLARLLTAVIGPAAEVLSAAIACLLRPRLGSAIPMAASRRLTEVIRPALASASRLLTGLVGSMP